jgi:hypothetical protein
MTWNIAVVAGPASGFAKRAADARRGAVATASAEERKQMVAATKGAIELVKTVTPKRTAVVSATLSGHASLEHTNDSLSIAIQQS